MTARRTNRLLAFIAAGGMLSAAFLSSPPANATPVQDAAFLGALGSVGITYASASRVITGAYSVCSSREAGFTEMEIVAKVLQGNDLTPYQAGFLVGAAEAAYCPAQAGNGYGAVKS